MGDLEQGDVIVARKESFENGEPIVKRVIATEGQTVDILYDGNGYGHGLRRRRAAGRALYLGTDGTALL